MENLSDKELIKEVSEWGSLAARGAVLALITERDQLRAQSEYRVKAWSREVDEVNAALAAAEERMAAMEGALRAALGLECASVADLGDDATGPACAICGSPFGCNENCPGYDVWREIQAALDGTTTSQEDKK